MQVHGPNHIHGPQPINPPHRNPVQSASAAALDRVESNDQLDISREAEFASRIRELPDIRTDRVAQIRGQIEVGNYETQYKLEIAVGRLLDELAG